jgi:hypothetical protein
VPLASDSPAAQNIVVSPTKSTQAVQTTQPAISKPPTGGGDDDNEGDDDHKSGSNYDDDEGDDD